jgi:protein phosphatase PTC7
VRRAVGHDILNTGEPLAASVTTITSAATSSFANAIYRLEVTTGACRGAGTSGRVNVILIGQDGITYPIDLEYTAGDAPGFARGSTLPFRVAVAAHLGPIRRARVRLLPDSTSTGRGWFLEDIGVKCEKTNESYKFTCRDWFGPSDADDTVSPYNRDLEATTVKNDFEVALEREQRTKMRREMGDFVFDVGAATIPHQDKIKEGARAKMSKSFGYGGEDAYFIETKKDDANDSNELSLGVADGVYMWRWEGVDAGLYSRALLREAAKTFMSATKVQDGSISAVDTGSSSSSSDSVSSSSETPKSTSDPSFMLERAFHAVTEKNVKGSTTCVLLTLDSRLGVLNAANIGDSGYLVARLSSGASSSSSSSSDGNAAGLHSLNDNETGAEEKVQRFIAYRSPPQEHDFGRPFQLGHHEATDTPADAMLSTFFLENDDVIVVGTDGLWDNVSEKEILSIIENRIKSSSSSSSSSSASTSSSSLGSNHAFSNKKEVDACAKELTQKAFEHANDRSRTTPYSLAATEHFDMVYSGGKKDDITVLVCKVRNRYRL